MQLFRMPLLTCNPHPTEREALADVIVLPVKVKPGICAATPTVPGEA